MTERMYKVGSEVLILLFDPSGDYFVLFLS